jgi:hypothetical protein
MKKNKKIAVSLFSTAVLASNLFLPNLAQAYSFTVPSLTSGGTVSIDVSKITQEATTEVESRYGFSSDVWKTAQRKVNAPKVEITFDNTNPKEGEKVTAHAIPEYFKNEAQNLYYTWYIIHTSDGTSQTATNSIASGKREAAKIMARGDYDPDLDGQTYSDSGKDPDSDGWPTVDSNSYDSGTDQAPMGGSDGKGGLASDSDNLDPGLSSYCSSRSKASNCTLYTTKDSFNSYYQFNGAQSNSYCSVCSASGLSWGTLSSNNQCCYLVQNPSDTTYSSYDSGTSYCPSSYDAAYESCFDYAALQSANQTTIESCLYTQCSTDYNDVHSTNVDTGTNSTDYSRCFKHNFGTSSNASGYQGYSGSSDSYSNDDSGLDYNVSCKHKWEDASGYTSGSGKLTTGEEDYWKTDPTDPDTDGDGFVDGADVIGLGQQEFTWTYQSGDRVGVVVEGTSMIPTDEKNAYYKIMWGYLDVCDSTKTGLLGSDDCDGSGDYGYGFLATKAPGEEGDEKLKASLSYTPDNPVADSETGSDKITVSSSLDNTELKQSDIYYTWQIQKGTLGDENSWKELDLSSNFDTSTTSSGLSLSSFSFTPKSSALTGSDDLVYFKVTLTISRSSGTESKRGRASVIIPVNKKGISLKFYQVDTKSGKAVLGKEVCSDTTYCPVVKNQLLAAKISSSSYTSSNSDFSWSINGKAYPTPSDPSDLFEGWTDTTIFFGIIESEGEKPSVAVTATPKSALQPVTGVRYLSVVSPSVSISTNDSSASWATTYVVEDDSQPNSSVLMTSKSVFEALTDSEVSYGLVFNPDYLYSDTANMSIDWKINGTSINSGDFSETDLGISEVTTENNGQTLNFTTGSTEGSSYTIEADVKKYWTADEKNILSTAWGINPDTLESSSSINVSTLSPSPSEALAPGNPGQILAAIGTHLPHYFMYLLRLALTIAVMFFLSAGLYGLTQKTKLFDEN